MSNTKDRCLTWGWVGWFIGAGSWIAYVATDDVFWLWMACIYGGIGSILLIAALMAGIPPDLQPKIEKEPAPSFPASFFMPFCVCPKCKVEALHWMEERQGQFILTPGGKKRFIGRGSTEVLRTCRECGHTWGQNVGLKNGG